MNIMFFNNKKNIYLIFTEIGTNEIVSNVYFISKICLTNEILIAIINETHRNI